jgi:hypothetical protein
MPNPFYTEAAHRVITLSGLAQLATDVKKVLREKGNPNKLFVINSSRDISVLVKLMPSDACYAVILQGSGQTHKTPILIHNNRFLILDSLGQAPTFHEIEHAIISSYPEASPPTILFSAHQRQSDMSNCGTDAIDVAKKALFLGKNLIDQQQQNGQKYCHPALAQLTQGVGRIHPLARKGVVQNQLYTNTNPEEMHALVVNPETERGTTMTRHFQDDEVIANGKYNLLLDNLAEQNFNHLDDLYQDLEQEDLYARARQAFPLNMLEKASSATLKKMFSSYEEKQQFIYEKLDMVKQQPGITLIAMPLLSDARHLKNKQAEIQLTCDLLEASYAEGNQLISLLDIAKLKYLLAYIEEKLSVLQHPSSPLFQQKRFMSDNAHLKLTPERVRSAQVTPEGTPEKKQIQLQPNAFFTPQRQKPSFSESGLDLFFKPSDENPSLDPPKNNGAAAADANTDDNWAEDFEEWGAAFDH